MSGRAPSGIPGRPRRGAAAAAAALLLVGLAAAPLAAETREVEVLGRAALPEEQATGAAGRRAALDDALAVAVARVAEGLLAESGRAGPAGAGAQDEVAALLPDPPSSYALRFQVLEDLGARGPTAAGAEGEAERALRVAVAVDTERLTRDLRRSGHLAPLPEGGTGLFRVEIQDPTWAALGAVRRALAGSGADAVVPERFEAGLAVLRVEGGPEGPRLLRVLRSRLPRGVDVELRALDAERLELRVRDRRAPAAGGAEADPSAGAAAPGA